MDSSSSKRKSSEVRRANVIYFLSRDGRMEHPHLIRVQHFCHSGVHLRDVKRWLSQLRGQQMPESFSWSYQRRYKNGFVWQDLMDDDLITPISDYEYVLLGSLLPTATADAAAAPSSPASAVTKHSRFNHLFYPEGDSTPESENGEVDNVTISTEDKPSPKEEVEEADGMSTYSKSSYVLPTSVACIINDSSVLDAVRSPPDAAVGDGGGGVGSSDDGRGPHCEMTTKIVGSTRSPPSRRQSSGKHSRLDSLGNCFSWFQL